MNYRLHGSAGMCLTRDQERSRRKRAVRARSISMKRLPKAAIEIGRAMFPETEYWKPRTRAECIDGHRPCPYVSCKHHLYLDVSPQTGAIKLNFPDLEVWELGESCALDIADRGGATLEEAGAIMNITRERIRQVEVRALARCEPSAGHLRDADSEGPVGKRRLPILVTHAQGEDQVNTTVEAMPNNVIQLRSTTPELKARMKHALQALRYTQSQAARDMGIGLPAFSMWLGYKGDRNVASNTSVAVQKWLDEHPVEGPGLASCSPRRSEVELRPESEPQSLPDLTNERLLAVLSERLLAQPRVTVQAQIPWHSNELRKWSLVSIAGSGGVITVVMRRGSAFIEETGTDDTELWVRLEAKAEEVVS